MEPQRKGAAEEDSVDTLGRGRSAREGEREGAGGGEAAADVGAQEEEEGEGEAVVGEDAEESDLWEAEGGVLVTAVKDVA